MYTIYKQYKKNLSNKNPIEFLDDILYSGIVFVVALPLFIFHRDRNIMCLVMMVVVQIVQHPHNAPAHAHRDALRRKLNLHIYIV